MPFKCDLRDQGQFPVNPVEDKEQDNWGGPACCKLALISYPTGSYSQCLYTQTYVAKTIQTYVKEKSAWYSDPYAVAATLNGLCPPPKGGTWFDISGTNKQEVLYTLLRWMANYKYPALTCLGKADRWVVLFYYETQDDPRVVADTKLYYIGYYDPPYYDPKTGNLLSGDGLSFLPDWMWFQSDNWDSPCPDGQMWLGKWIGVGEPPEETGTIQVEMVARVGEKLLNSQECSRIAQNFLKKWMKSRPDVLPVNPRGLQVAKPLLVRELPIQSEERGEPENEIDVRYYVVPFQQRFAVDGTGSPLAVLGILVNAFTGRVEELRVFPKPVRYLAKKEAVAIARQLLDLSAHEADRLEVELVFAPLHYHVSRALPAWSVAFKDRNFFITQQGNVLASLASPRLLGS